MMRVRLFQVLAVAACLFVTPSPLRAAEAVALTEAVKAKVQGLSTQLPRPTDQDGMRDFYGARNFAPLWIIDGRISQAARELVAELSQADAWGLDGADIAPPTLPTDGALSVEAAADLDYAISASVLKYATQARGGRISNPEAMLSEFLDRRPTLPTPAAVLNTMATAANAREALLAFHPKHPQFRKLQAIYAKERAVTPATPRVAMNAEGKLLAPGMSHPEVAVLRQVLSVAPGENAEVFDDDVKAAVKRFQADNDLSADGLVGPRTRDALHEATPGSKLRHMRANLEQWRWMPQDLGAKHLFVNIPSYNLKLVENDAVALEERVIVGKQDTPTPVFSEKLSTVVLKPMWFMPDSIKTEKLQSMSRRGRSLEDEGYIVKKGKKVVDSSDVDWDKVDVSAYTFYQPAGAGNALGDVKFLFPNKHSVYLHDTPSKKLFQADVRTFSHGCVRLRNPVTLAQTLLDGDAKDHDTDVVKALRKLEDSAYFTLAKPLPMHIAHFTQWVDDDGALETFDDTYGHAERIAAALEAHTTARTGETASAAPVAVVPTPKNDAAAQPKPAVRFALAKPVAVQSDAPRVMPTADQLKPLPVTQALKLQAKVVAPKPAAVAARPAARAPKKLAAAPDPVVKFKQQKASSSPRRREAQSVGDMIRNALVN